MLLIRTQLGPSRIHGLGVFAAEAVAAGTEVWRFTPGFDLEVDPKLVEQQPGIAREALWHYGYLDPRINRYVLCADNARFINHSDTPNLQSDYGRDARGVDVAARDIAAGEELTIDYGLVEGKRPGG